MIRRFPGIAITFFITGFTMSIALGTATQVSAQQVITCESNNRERAVCPVDTRGDVRLVKRLSNTSCEGNWGYNRNRIWVRNGCRAQFLVENRRDDRDDSYNRRGKYDDHRRGDDDRYDRDDSYNRRGKYDDRRRGDDRYDRDDRRNRRGRYDRDDSRNRRGRYEWRGREDR